MSSCLQGLFSIIIQVAKLKNLKVVGVSLIKYLDERFPTVFVSCGNCNKLLQIWWLKTLKFILIVLEAKSLKFVSLDQKESVCRAPSGDSRGERSIPCLFQP